MTVSAQVYVLLLALTLAGAQQCRVCQEIQFSDPSMQETVGEAMAGEGGPPCTSPVLEDCSMDCLTIAIDMTMAMSGQVYDYKSMIAMCAPSSMTCSMIEDNMPDLSSAGIEMTITDCEIGADIFGDEDDEEEEEDLVGCWVITVGQKFSSAQWDNIGLLYDSSDAKTACSAIDDCVGFHCNTKKGGCTLLRGYKDMRANRKFVTYLNTCNGGSDL